VGGQGAIRSVWRHYYQGVSGVVFVVDSSDRQRFKEAAKELKTMFEESAGDLGNAHLLVLCNKQDLDGAANVSELKEALNVSAVRTEGMYYVQPCCGLTGTLLRFAYLPTLQSLCFFHHSTAPFLTYFFVGVGINEGFQWLAGKLNTNTSTCTIS